MDRLDYQERIIKLLDKALDNLDVDQFNKLLENVKEIVENYE